MIQVQECRYIGREILGQCIFAPAFTQVAPQPFLVQHPIPKPRSCFFARYPPSFVTHLQFSFSDIAPHCFLKNKIPKKGSNQCELSRKQRPQWHDIYNNNWAGTPPHSCEGLDAVCLCWNKLGHVGSRWFKLVQIDLKKRLCWLKFAWRCSRWPPEDSKRITIFDFKLTSMHHNDPQSPYYVGSSWPEEFQDGLSESSRGWISSNLSKSRCPTALLNHLTAWLLKWKSN